MANRGTNHLMAGGEDGNVYCLETPTEVENKQEKETHNKAV
jgi:hypothetical protein